MQKSKTQDEILSHMALLQFLREEIVKAGSQKAWAKDNNVEASHLTRVLKWGYPPNARLLAAIGYEEMPRRYRKVSGRKRVIERG